jgi:hypothetical protein
VLRPSLSDRWLSQVCATLITSVLILHSPSVTFYDIHGRKGKVLIFCPIRHSGILTYAAYATLFQNEINIKPDSNLLLLSFWIEKNQHQYLQTRFNLSVFSCSTSWIFAVVAHKAINKLLKDCCITVKLYISIMLAQLCARSVLYCNSFILGTTMCKSSHH